jgi:hypothetical protein
LHDAIVRHVVEFGAFCVVVARQFAWHLVARPCLGAVIESTNDQGRNRQASRKFLWLASRSSLRMCSWLVADRSLRAARADVSHGALSNSAPVVRRANDGTHRTQAL